MENHYDAVVIGGGAAGLSAGIVLARAQATVLLIDEGQPRNAPADGMHGFLSRDGLPPKDLVTIGAAEFTHYGGKIHHNRVDTVAKLPTGTFDVTLLDGTTIGAKTLLLATGLKDQLPDISGIKAAWGTKIHHCPHCHGYEVRAKNIVVVGSNIPYMTMHQVALLRRLSSTITVCTNNVTLSEHDHTRLRSAGIAVIDTPIVEFFSRHDLGIKLSNGSEIHCDCAFIAPKPVPNNSIAQALGCDCVPETGFVLVDHTGLTTVPGVWAAGNLVNPQAQVITAASEGSVAGIAMAGFLAENAF